jgi:hypothetical protein
MYNCSKDVLAHHDLEVTLPQAERTEMRKRRDSNRDRLKKGLDKNGWARPLYFKSQGSYAMKTMTQHPELDYDIDDGVYFAKADLVGPRGAELTALEARQRVRDAVDDGSFTQAPEVRKNCVRVYYQKGYHVDLPVYRQVVTKDVWGRETIHNELASSTWKRSDACDVSAWFEKQNTDQSPDEGNGRQLRRTVRQIKAFARSRDSWKGKILSGFGITKLVTELYRKDADREDKALYDTMKAIRDRLQYDLVVKHPCTQGDTITNGTSDPKAVFLRDKLTEALNNMDVLFKYDCTRTQALKAWDKVFNTTFFSDRDDTVRKAAASFPAPAILSRGLIQANALEAATKSPVRSEGGGRYA